MILPRTFHYPDCVSSGHDQEPGLKLIDPERRDEMAPVPEEPDQMTVRPNRSPATSKKILPSLIEDIAPRSTSESFVEDYSDIAIGEDENGLESKLASLKVSLTSLAVLELII